MGTIALAHRLRMMVVAKGVETLEQSGYRRAHGCGLSRESLCKALSENETRASRRF